MSIFTFEVMESFIHQGDKDNINLSWTTTALNVEPLKYLALIEEMHQYLKSSDKIH